MKTQNCYEEKVGRKVRDVKFRAWDYNKESMVRVLGFVHTYYVVYDGKTEYVSHKDNLMLMQSTGLKDICGKDIYEGDIIEIRYFGEPYYFAEVVFEHGSFWGKGGGTPGYLLCEHLDERVVGNVCEDSNLL